MAFRRRADDGPLIVVLGSSLPSSIKKKTKKTNVVKIGPPLTKLLDPRICVFINIHTFFMRPSNAPSLLDNAISTIKSHTSILTGKRKATCKFSIHYSDGNKISDSKHFQLAHYTYE